MPGLPNPAAAYLSSMLLLGGGTTGVSGGGGEPLVARVVITEAVESKRLRPPSCEAFGLLAPLAAWLAGGGKYC